MIPRLGGFGDDHGEADPTVVAALSAVVDAMESGSADLAAREEELLARVLTARFLVPVVPAPPDARDHDEEDHDEQDHDEQDHDEQDLGAEDHDGHDHNHNHDHNHDHDENHDRGAGGGPASPHAAREAVDMATVVLHAPDGTAGLPVFTGLEAMAGWDATARPVPIPAVATAQGAIGDDCSVLLVDLGSAHAVVLRSSMMWALAQVRPWLPPYADPIVTGALAAAVRPFGDLIVDAVAEDGREVGAGVTRIRLTLRPGLTGTQVDDIVTVIGVALAEDPEVRCRLDDVAFALHQA